MNAPGRGKLKVTGVLYIIGGLLGIAGVIVLLAAGGLLAAAEDGSGMGALLSQVAGGNAGVQLCMVLVTLLVGVLGVKNCDKPEACGVNFVLGIVMIVIQLAYIGIQIMGSGLSAAVLIAGLISLIIPVIYTIGAKQNKDAA